MDVQNREAILMDNESSDEELHNFKRVITQVTARPEISTEEPTSSPPAMTPEANLPKNTPKPHGQPSTSKPKSNARNSKRKWGRRKSRLSKWRHRS